MLEFLLEIIRGLNEGDDIASIATKSKWDQGLACLTLLADLFGGSACFIK